MIYTYARPSSTWHLGYSILLVFSSSLHIDFKGEEVESPAPVGKTEVIKGLGFFPGTRALLVQHLYGTVYRCLIHARHSWLLIAVQRQRGNNVSGFFRCVPQYITSVCRGEACKRMLSMLFMVHLWWPNSDDCHVYRSTQAQTVFESSRKLLSQP